MIKINFYGIATIIFFTVFVGDLIKIVGTRQDARTEPYQWYECLAVGLVFIGIFILGKYSKFKFVKKNDGEV